LLYRERVDTDLSIRGFAMGYNEECIKTMQDTTAVRSALRDVVRCFNAHLPDVRWCAHAGTALAMFYGRGRKTGGMILPGDNDIDIAVLSETVDFEEFIKAFDADGFKPVYMFNDPLYPETGVVVRFQKDEVPIDFYWLYGRGRKRWWLTAPRTPHVLPAYLFEEFKPMKLLSVELPAPFPLEAYCCNMWKKVGDRFPAAPEGESLTVDWEWRVKP